MTETNDVKPRRAFESGHRRKFLVVVDESKEAEAALYYASSRMQRSGGILVLLYVIEPGDYQHWAGVKQVQLEEETAKAKAVFRLFRRKLAIANFDTLEVEEVIREGKKGEAIIDYIAEDEDVTILVLGAAVDSKGPGPLVASLASGKQIGGIPVPVTVVPGNLTLEDIMALA